jgi:uncharacterized protein (TIGR02594 family)
VFEASPCRALSNLKNGELMRTKKAKTVRKKATRRKTTKPIAARRPIAAVATSTKPTRRKRGDALYNGGVLVAAIVTLAVFAGSAALPRLFGPVAPPVARLNDAAVARAIDRAVAEYRSEDRDAPIFIMPAVKAAAPSTESKVETTPDAAQAKVEIKPEAKPKSTRRAERHRAAAVKDPHGLHAMASVSSNDLITEARKYLGGNPTGWARDWCGKFLDMVLKKTGHKGGGNLARGYIKYGTRLAGPQVGAIAVFSRKGGGHVGIVTGVDANGNPIIISGNYNDRVAIATYPASRALAYVWPSE